MNDKEKKELIILGLKNVIDPELGFDIWNLGLIYGIHINNEDVKIIMTFTSPACPSMEFITSQVYDNIEILDFVESVRTEVVWDPPWSKGMISDEVKMEIGIYD